MIVYDDKSLKVKGVPLRTHSHPDTHKNNKPVHLYVLVFRRISSKFAALYQPVDVFF